MLVRLRKEGGAWGWCQAGKSVRLRKEWGVSYALSRYRTLRYGRTVVITTKGVWKLRQVGMSVRLRKGMCHTD